MVVLFSAACTSQVLPFQSYTVKDGLISNSINKLYQDARGYIWIGTSDGISVFDGRSFTNYTTNDGLANNYVTDILEDNHDSGTMWIATYGGGISKFSRGRFTTFSLGASVKTDRVQTLYQDHLGVIWCGTDSSTFRIDKDRTLPFTVSNEVVDITSIAESGDGLMWFGNESGLYYYSRPSDQVGKFNLRLSGSTTVGGMFTDVNGDLWVAAWNGTIVRIHDKTIVQRCDHAPGGMTFFLDDREGRIWIGSYGGLFRLSKSNLDGLPPIRYSENEGLPENTLHAGMIDKEQNLWIGGIGKGIAKLVRTNIFCFPPVPFDATHHHAIAASDSNDHVWVVSPPAGVWEYWCDGSSGTGKWHQFLHRLTISPQSILSPAKNVLWIGLENGRIDRYEIQAKDHRPSQLKLMQTLDPHLGLPAHYLMSFIVDKHRRLWCSYADLGIVLLDPSRPNPVVRIYSTADSVPANFVTALYEDREGNIWAGSFLDGVVRLLGSDIESGGTFHRVPALARLRDERVWWFTSDNDGRIWIATHSNGVAILGHDSLRLVSLSDGLISNKINSITDDDHGEMWLGTSRGIAHVNLHVPETPKYIDEVLGSWVLSSGRTAHGLLWFFSGNGLIIYDPSTEFHNRVPPPVYISQFRVNGNSVGIDDDHEFAYDQNNCVINFIGISFRDERGIRYRYRLDGIDHDWQPPTDQNSVTYGALRPGAYTFRVDAIDAEGMISTAPAALSFSIRPSFWMTWWFRSLVVILFSSIGPIIYYRRVAVFKRERQMQQQFSRQLIDSQESERRRIAGELHDSLGQELLVIKNRALMGLQLTGRSPDVKEHFDEISSAASAVLKEVRLISQNLRPYQLDRLGLTAALESMMEKIAESAPMQFTFSLGNLDDVVPRESEIIVYRIVQEGVNNILKHSEARHATVAARRTDKQLCIMFEDDGRGFSTEILDSLEAPLEGSGLRGMRERVKMIGGMMSIRSAPGSGTSLTVTIPITEQLHGS